MSIKVFQTAIDYPGGALYTIGDGHSTVLDFDLDAAPSQKVGLWGGNYPSQVFLVNLAVTTDETTNASFSASASLVRGGRGVRIIFNKPVPTALFPFQPGDPGNGSATVYLAFTY